MRSVLISQQAPHVGPEVLTRVFNNKVLFFIVAFQEGHFKLEAQQDVLSAASTSLNFHVECVKKRNETQHIIVADTRNMSVKTLTFILLNQPI